MQLKTSEHKGLLKYLQAAKFLKINCKLRIAYRAILRTKNSNRAEKYTKYVYLYLYFAKQNKKDKKEIENSDRADILFTLCIT